MACTGFSFNPESMIYISSDWILITFHIQLMMVESMFSAFFLLKIASLQAVILQFKYVTQIEGNEANKMLLLEKPQWFTNVNTHSHTVALHGIKVNDAKHNIHTLYNDVVVLLWHNAYSLCVFITLGPELCVVLLFVVCSILRAFYL